MASTQYVPIKMTRGDTLEFSLRTPDMETDLASCFFTCRNAFGGNILFQKSLNSGITKEADGLYYIRIAPADTADLNAGTYVYDLEIGYGSDIFTPIEGSFTVSMDVTWRT